MPPPSPAPGTPQDWLVRAPAMMVLARLLLREGAMWEELVHLTIADNMAVREKEPPAGQGRNDN